MYLFGGYEPVPDAPYIEQYGDDTYEALYEQEGEEDDGEAFVF